MIIYYLGIPGSGKSYAGVDLIYNNFTDNDDAKKDLKKGYLSAYTNINDFKFDKCQNVYNFDYDVFYKQLSELHTMYKDKKSDDELIEKAKEFNIYKTLFVIDECHNYLSLPDKVLIWWLTYHRHLYHDIILITQNLQLVNAKFKPLAEAFYKAKSSSLTLNKKYFHYMYYTESRLTKASFVNTKKVLKRKGVFELYKSGDSVESKNVILRFIYIAIFMFLLLLVGGYYFISSSTSTTSIKNHSVHHIVNDEDTNVSSDVVVPDSDFDASNVVLVVLTCTNDMCSYKNTYFDIKVLSYAKDKFYFHIINSRRMFASVKLSIAVDNSFLNFIQGINNADTQNISDSIFNTSTK